MAEKKRPVIGVAAAEVNHIEQRQILHGIIAQAQALQMDVAVISNIYNSNLPVDHNDRENEIYDLIRSPDLDGLIVLSESFVTAALKERLRQSLSARRELPVIAVGTPLAELAELRLTQINTDGERDLEELTDHLIDVHGFREIDILTGPSTIDDSGVRLQGYRNALRKHGIPYESARVHEGNFWMNSGEALAKQYLSGALPMPQAVVCTNDYMAYGVLDTMTEHDMPVPETLTVVGYEYVWERIYHTPLLTTYQRNRAELGRTAVEMLYRQLRREPVPAFSAPRGVLVCGETCPCRRRSQQYDTELKSARTDKMYSDWHVTSPMDRELVDCSNVDDLAETMGKNSILVRSVQDMMLCLYEKWYDTEANDRSLIACRSVLPWKDNSATLYHKYNLAGILARNSIPAAYYFTPLFQGENVFGYLVLKYETPDTYDVLYKNWVKSVCNTLEYIRMKNDIRYFRMYDTLSEQYDAATGLYHAAGFENVLRYAARQAGDAEGLFLLVRLLPPDDAFEHLNRQVSIYAEVAECLRMLSGTQDGICGRLERNLFAFALFGELPDPALLHDKLRVLVALHSSCVREWGMDAFVTAAQTVHAADFHYHQTLAPLREQLAQTEQQYAARRLMPHYPGFRACRSALYLHPEAAHPLEQYCLQLGFSEGHFRKLYRDFFGISFHQEVTAARIAAAKYLLCTSMADTASIAGRCGFEDVKYFMRTFQKAVGCTVRQYRQRMYTGTAGKHHRST